MSQLALLFFILGLQTPSSLAQLNYSNCSKPVQIAEPGKRLVSLDINSTELALALNLQSSLVAVAAFENYQLLPEYAALAKNIPRISRYYPSLSQLQSVSPDLVIGGWRNGFSHGTPVEPENLLSKGIATYVLRETCVHEKDYASEPISFENTLFEDLETLAHITGSEERGQKLIAQMRRRLDAIAADVKIHGREESVRIMVYDGGSDKALSIGGQALFSEAIRLAGGLNIFREKPGSWQDVEWDEVVRADPEMIVVVDYGSGDAAFKVRDLLHNTTLQSVSAIKEKRFFIVPYAAVITGIRSVGITELLADHLICTFNNLSNRANQCLDVASAL